MNARMKRPSAQRYEYLIARGWAATMQTTLDAQAAAGWEIAHALITQGDEGRDYTESDSRRDYLTLIMRREIVQSIG